MPGSQVIVGLGNPGPEYVASRHNVGHAVVDRLGARLGARFRLQGPAHVAEVPCREPALYLAKLLAVMNVSGPSVGRLLRLLALEPAALILVYDDLDLPYGRVRVRRAGRHGGHNGVRSVIETLGTEAIRRVKVGIGRPETRDPETVAAWVLTPFTREEAEALPAVLEKAGEAALRLATGPGEPS